MSDDSTTTAAPLHEYVIPTDFDFLRGRGGTNNTRATNQWVLGRICKLKPQYKKLKRGKDGKFAMALRVVKELHGRGGRFLDIEKDENGNIIGYFKMDETSSVKLVQQKLREKESNSQSPVEIAESFQQDTSLVAINGSFSEDDNQSWVTAMNFDLPSHVTAHPEEEKQLTDHSQSLKATSCEARSSEPPPSTLNSVDNVSPTSADADLPCQPFDVAEFDSLDLDWEQSYGSLWIDHIPLDDLGDLDLFQQPLDECITEPLPSTPPAKLPPRNERNTGSQLSEEESRMLDKFVSDIMYQETGEPVIGTGEPSTADAVVPSHRCKISSDDLANSCLDDEPVMEDFVCVLHETPGLA